MAGKELFSFYVGAKFEEKERAKKLIGELEQLGGKLTSDWTTHVPISPYSQNREMAEKYAAEDIGGVITSDLAIFLTHQEPSMGLATELGAAIATSMTFEQFGKPRVWVVGNYLDRNIFNFHTMVDLMENEEEVLSRVREIWKTDLR